MYHACVPHTTDTGLPLFLCWSALSLSDYPTGSLACSCLLGAGCGISTGLRVALLRLLSDTEGRSCFNSPTPPLCSASGATRQSCSSQIEAQRAFAGFRFKHYPCPGTPALHGAMPPLTGSKLRRREASAQAWPILPGHLFPHLHGLSGILGCLMLLC